MATSERDLLTEIEANDIVVGVDGSPASKAALRWALTQAELTGARVQAVTAWELPLYYGWAGVVPYDDFAAVAGKTLAESVQEVVGVEQPAVEVLESVIAGHAAQVLLDLSNRAALLVLGSRGHGGFAGTLLGSVSQHCVQHARCPVVVVRGRS
jgi:nucleotide-binding universal stress UspA family protein